MSDRCVVGGQVLITGKIQVSYTGKYDRVPDPNPDMYIIPVLHVTCMLPVVYLYVTCSLPVCYL